MAIVTLSFVSLRAVPPAAQAQISDEHLAVICEHHPPLRGPRIGDERSAVVASRTRRCAAPNQ